jgi:SAM-dependent methyltransferase
LTDEYADVALLYDHVVPYATRGDVEFFVDEALAAQGPVLEIGCGTGRVLIPTARAGVSITGLDASSAMLARCREKIAAEPSKVQQCIDLVEADMRAFDLGKKFALATFPFRPFQHLLTTEDQVACLTTVHRHLEHDGRLVLDLFNPSLDYLVNRPLGLEIPEGPATTLPDGRSLERTFKIVNADRFEQINDIELIYNVTDSSGRTRRSVHAFRMRYLFRFEVEHLLARAGFAVEQLYAGFDRSAYGSTYPGELIFVARKVA